MTAHRLLVVYMLKEREVEGLRERGEGKRKKSNNPNDKECLTYTSIIFYCFRFAEKFPAITLLAPCFMPSIDEEKKEQNFSRHRQCWFPFLYDYYVSMPYACVSVCVCAVVRLLCIEKQFSFLKPELWRGSRRRKIRQTGKSEWWTRTHTKQKTSTHIVSIISKITLQMFMSSCDERYFVEMSRKPIHKSRAANDFIDQNLLNRKTATSNRVQTAAQHQATILFRFTVQ